MSPNNQHLPYNRLTWGSLAMSLALWLGLAHHVAAQPLTPEQVRESIRKGVEYLKGKQQNGNWEHLFPSSQQLMQQWYGGPTSLATLALLECGVDPNDDVIQKSLRFLRDLEPKSTYVVSLQTMVFCKAAPKVDRLRIKRNVDWLVRNAKRIQVGGGLAWGYPYEAMDLPDNSNTQYAVLALREAAVAGVNVPNDIWKGIQRYYLDTQMHTGGWNYRGATFGLRTDERITMTAAGVCGLLISGMQLYRVQENLRADGTVQNCGQFVMDDALSKGIKRLGQIFSVTNRMPNKESGTEYKFYNIYGLERAGRLSGQRFWFDANNDAIDWYRLGADHLLKIQKQDGSWKGENSESREVIATSFALLFLAKGKTPVLFFKMTHGADRGLSGDWNNDRNDIRNLTEYCSNEIFKKDGRPTPLTWQIYDASRLAPGDPESLKDMLQAPIVYFNGHKAPRFSEGEKALLKAYIDQGGFILAEACCGRKEFDEGFRKLMEEMFPDWPLEPLPEGHPVWSAAYNVPPGSFKLEGISRGCKTVLVYAPQDLSCHWESNRFDEEQANGPVLERTILAFRTGANIVAYATGLEPPQDKLSKKELTKYADDPTPRNYLQVAQVDYGGRDWQPAPNAMRVVMDHVAKTQGIDVIRQTKPIRLLSPDLPQYKFLYMHGRREFTLDDNEILKLKDHLHTGGFLLADAACGNESFDQSFRAMVGKAFGRPLEPITVDDKFYSDDISHLFRSGAGQPVKQVLCRTQRGKPYQSMDPFLEGMRLDPKNPRSPWIIVYSKYDLGCALDKHASTDCIGYNTESALQIATQAVLYLLKE